MSMGVMPNFASASPVAGVVASRQDAAVHERVQRLDAPVHHLGRPGDLGHLEHGQPGLLERLGGAAGGDEAAPAGRQAAGKLDDAGLVGDADQGSHDGSRSGEARSRHGGQAPDSGRRKYMPRSPP